MEGRVILHQLRTHPRAWRQVPGVMRHLSTTPALGGLLSYQLAVPRHVPMGRTYTFHYADRTIGRTEGQSIGEEERGLIGTIPEKRIRRIERSELLGYPNKELIFDARSPFTPGKALNPIPPLAVLFTYIELDGYTIDHARLHGSFARGTTSNNSDTDLALVFREGKSPGLNDVSGWNMAWPYGVYKPSIKVYTPAAWAQVMSLRKQFGRDEAPSTIEEFRRVGRATDKLPNHVREAVWNPDTVELMGPGRNIVRELLDTVEILEREFAAGNRSTDILRALAIFGIQSDEVVRATAEQIRAADTGGTLTWSRTLELAELFSDPEIASALLTHIEHLEESDSVIELLRVCAKVSWARTETAVKNYLEKIKKDSDRIEFLRALVHKFGGDEELSKARALGDVEALFRTADQAGDDLHSRR